MKKKIIVGISGASGVIYGISFLKMLRDLDIETHLVISKSANITINRETDLSINSIKKIADYIYNPMDIGASISSGSFKTDGMVILPCSMKSLSAIANGYEDNLLIRAASVVIKEQKQLILMIRETPLHVIHIENMLKLARCGVAICPAVPAFYSNPNSINDLIRHTLVRILDLFNVSSPLPEINRWSGL